MATAIQETTREDSRAPSERKRRRAETSRAQAAALDETAKAQIYRQSRWGLSVEVLAAQSGLSQKQVVQVINEVRAKRLLELKLEFMYDASFEEAGAVAAILGPFPAADPAHGSRRGRAPDDLPPYL